MGLSAAQKGAPTRRQAKDATPGRAGDGRLAGVVLLAVQLVVGVSATPRLLQALPPFGGLSLFVDAVRAGLVVWLVGLALSQVVRDTRQPSGATFSAFLRRQS